MSASRRAIAGFVIAVIAGVAAWMLWSSADSSPPSPKPATPHGGVAAPAARPAASREASKETGQAATPPDLEREETVPGSDLDMPTLANCHAALVVKQIAENRTRCANVPVEDSNSQDYCRRQQAAMAQELQKATAASASCPQVLGGAPAYYEAVKALALRGDVPAQRCFIQGYFQNWSEEGNGDSLRTDQLKEYPGLARKFIDDSFGRGDWSVVRWLGRITLQRPDALLQKAYPLGTQHLETTYRMKYLLMLGHQPDTQGDDPRRIVEAWQKEQMVTTEQATDGQRWAQEMFDRHFSGSQEGATVTDISFCKSG